MIFVIVMVSLILVLLLGDFNFSRLEWVIGKLFEYKLSLIWVLFNHQTIYDLIWSLNLQAIKQFEKQWHLSRKMRSRTRRIPNLLTKMTLRCLKHMYGFFLSRTLSFMSVIHWILVTITSDSWYLCLPEIVYEGFRTVFY